MYGYYLFLNVRIGLLNVLFVHEVSRFLKTYCMKEFLRKWETQNNKKNQRCFCCFFKKKEKETKQIIQKEQTS